MGLQLPNDGPDRQAGRLLSASGRIWQPVDFHALNTCRPRTSEAKFRQCVKISGSVAGTASPALLVTDLHDEPSGDQALFGLSRLRIVHSTFRQAGIDMQFHRDGPSSRRVALNVPMRQQHN